MAAPKTRTGSKKDAGKTDATKAQEAAEAKAEGNGEGNAEEKESARERAAKEKAEAAAKARDAQIEAGNLLVLGKHEFEKATKETKVTGQVHEIIDILKESDEPVVFQEVCKKVGANYPEDILPAMLSLEYVGLVTRWVRRETDSDSRRGQTSYQWTGGNE
jgi:hypothetical protein